MENGNVILFPKWKRSLEEDSLLALKEKRYEEALHKLEQLIHYQVNNHEIVIGKLICLMELDRHDEAQELSEELLHNKNEHYYHYVHIYLTILFQTNQYNRLIEQVEYEFETAEVPQPLYEQFQQLYDMSKKMNIDIMDERHKEYINELLEAVKEENHIKQWRLVENLRKINASPSIKTVETLLKKDTVHPVTKTAIFKWLQDNDIKNPIQVHKFDVEVCVEPNAISEIHSHSIYNQIQLLINQMEQKNPSLYNLMETLLHQYIYVRFPIMPPSEHVGHIANALMYLGETYLGINSVSEEQVDSEVLRYKEEIQLCETLYLSIIEE